MPLKFGDDNLLETADDGSKITRMGNLMPQIIDTDPETNKSFMTKREKKDRAEARKTTDTQVEAKRQAMRDGAREALHIYLGVNYRVQFSVTIGGVVRDYAGYVVALTEKGVQLSGAYSNIDKVTGECHIALRFIDAGTIMPCEDLQARKKRFEKRPFPPQSTSKQL